MKCNAYKNVRYIKKLYLRKCNWNAKIHYFTNIYKHNVRFYGDFMHVIQIFHYSLTFIFLGERDLNNWTITTTTARRLLILSKVFGLKINFCKETKSFEFDTFVKIQNREKIKNFFQLSITNYKIRISKKYSQSLSVELFRRTIE